MIASGTPSVSEPMTVLPSVSVVATPEQSVSLSIVKPTSSQIPPPTTHPKPSLLSMTPPPPPPVVTLPSTSIASPTVQSPQRLDPSSNRRSSSPSSHPISSTPPAAAAAAAFPASGTGSASTTTTASAPIMTAPPVSFPDRAVVPSPTSSQHPPNGASSSLTISPNFVGITTRPSNPNDSAQPAVPFARMPPGSTLAAKAKRASDAVITPFTQPPNDDPLRTYYAKKDMDGTDDLSPRQLENLRQISWHRIPLTVQQASDSLDMAGFQRPDITSCLTVLNIKSHSILRIDIQRRILAIKLVQRQLCLFAIVQCRKNVDKQKPQLVTEQHRRIRSLPPTSVWRSPRVEGPLDEIPWSTGDVPIFDSFGNIIPGHPPLDPSNPAAVQPSPRQRASTRGRARTIKRGLRRSTRDDPNTSLDNVSLEVVPTGTSSRPKRPSVARAPRSPPQIDDSEYCRLLHVLTDSRAERARALLQISRDPEPHFFREVSVIYNDRTYRPDRIPLVDETVTSSDIASIHPENLRHSRSPRELADMFTEFRTKFALVLETEFKTWLAGSSDKKAALAYAFCQVHHSPDLKRIMTPIRPNGRTRKRRKISTEVVTQVNNGQERHHEDELKSFELEEARMRVVTATLVAMREARGLSIESNADDDRKFCTDVIEHLTSRLRKQLPAPSP